MVTVLMDRRNSLPVEEKRVINEYSPGRRRNSFKVPRLPPMPPPPEPEDNSDDDDSTATVTTTGILSILPSISASSFPGTHGMLTLSPRNQPGITKSAINICDVTAVTLGMNVSWGKDVKIPIKTPESPPRRRGSRVIRAILSLGTNKS